LPSAPRSTRRLPGNQHRPWLWLSTGSRAG